MSAEHPAYLADVSLKQLRPDWENPRFPPGAHSAFTSDIDVYAYLVEKFDAFSVAESIARHGFFLSEPLIVIPAEGDAFIVVEGNRRLAALQALASSEVLAVLGDLRWDTLAGQTHLPETIPVLVAASRAQVAPILGYRHVTGIAPWDPYQQARYVASLIDSVENPLGAEEVSRLIGRNVSEVRSFYRNFSIVEQARDYFEMPDPDRIIEEFGVWTRAMTSVGIREYIGAPAPKDVVEGAYPLPDGSAGALDRIVRWIFGDERSSDDLQAGRQSKEGRLITDSRQISRLSRVLQTKQGQDALESGMSLARAEKASTNPSLQFGSDLEVALEALESARKLATADLVRQNQSKLGLLEQLIIDMEDLK